MQLAILCMCVLEPVEDLDRGYGFSKPMTLTITPVVSTLTKDAEVARDIANNAIIKAIKGGKV